MNAGLLFPAAFLAGFFGSSHCIGMCGAIVVLLEQQAHGAPGRWSRRILYNAGRLGFYVVLGSIAAAGGAILTQLAGVRPALMILRLLAGLLVIGIGLNLIFDLSATRFLERAGAGLWRRLAPLARHVLPVSTHPRAFAAGFLWGALPCGLVYSAVALAATSGSAPGGAAVMLAFWLGTLPALLLAGASADGLDQWRRKRNLRRIAGALMLAIGALAAMPVAKTLLNSL